MHRRLALIVIAVGCGKDTPAPPPRLFTEEEIAAYEAKLMARIAETAKRTCPRPVVREPGADGPATADLIAIAEPTGPLAACLPAMTKLLGTATAKLNELVEQRDPRVIELEATCGQALEQAVRKAAAHRDACSPYQIGVRKDPDSWMSVLHGAHLLGLRARLSDERGAPASALAMLLDGASAYRDLGRGHVGLIPAMIAVASTDVVLDHARAIVTTAKLTPDELTPVIAGVDALLASEPSFADALAGERHYFEIFHGLVHLKGDDWVPPGGWLDGTDARPDVSVTKSPRDEGAIIFAAAEKMAAERETACPQTASLKACHDGLTALGEAASKVKSTEVGENLWNELAKTPRSVDTLATAHRIRDAIVAILVNVAHPAFEKYAGKRAAGYARLSAFRIHLEVARAGRCPTEAELAAPPYAPLLVPPSLGDALTVTRLDGGDLDVAAPAWAETKKPPWQISCKPR